MAKKNTIENVNINNGLAANDEITTRNRVPRPGFITLQKLATLGLIDWKRQGVVFSGKNSEGREVLQPVRLTSLVGLTEANVATIINQGDSTGRAKYKKITDLKAAYNQLLEMQSFTLAEGVKSEIDRLENEDMID